MNRLWILSIMFILGCTFNDVKNSNAINILNQAPPISIDTCVDFNSLNDKIRDGLIAKDEALKQINVFLPQLDTFYYKNGGQNFPKSKWVFPVQGYTFNSIGGINGSGYIVSGYDYFDGNKHKGHPAQDIFINDRNQDGYSDATKKPVNVLSMTGGIVIATKTEWDTTSVLRGGKYIWIYDPNSRSFFYYAHNSHVMVSPCDIVKPGDTIATVGRTGLNAYKKRSPTHLHLMQLLLDSNDYPKPVDCYKVLILLKG
ncbi:MAG: M23 family metallopeptidase [Bacteroidota bacterium]